MPARRLTLVLVMLVLVLGAIGAARRDATRTPATTTTSRTTPQSTTTGPTATTGVPAAPVVVEGTLPVDRVIRARVGDSVDVRVRSDVPDIARIVDVGVSGAVGPNLPGELRFTADAPGRYPVLLEVAGRRAGLVIVSPAA